MIFSPMYATSPGVGPGAAVRPGWSLVDSRLKGLKVTADTRDQAVDRNDVPHAVANQARAAFTTLLRHFGPRVKCPMPRFSSDHHRAQELALGTMVSAWRKADRFGPAGTAAATLPPEQREAPHMSFFVDRAHSEISGALNIPPGAVQSKIRLTFGWVKTSLGDPFEQ